ncbi:MAG: MATE family efflux transporter, partial [Butyrivibrio sp.]|nr:MATE family efflux transporter [Butyrivibrio sp.]
VITAFSNVFVQSYINYFGSDCMAGWSSYNKLDSFIMLPLQSMAMAATTFVSQNIGAGKVKRADEGTRTVIIMGVLTTGFIALLLYIFARPAIRMFSAEQAVIDYGALFIHTNVFFLMFNCVNHTLASSLRGRGDSTGPMVIMLSTFVALRQTYLYILTHYIANTPKLVGFGYPVGWMSCCLVEVTYYLVKYKVLKKGPS